MQKRPSLGVRTKHLYPRDEEEEENGLGLQDAAKGPQGYSQGPQDAAKGPQGYNQGLAGQGRRGQREREREVVPPQQVQVEARPSITVRRERINVSRQGAEEDDSKPVATCGYPLLMCVCVCVSVCLCVCVCVTVCVCVCV